MVNVSFKTQALPISLVPVSLYFYPNFLIYGAVTYCIMNSRHARCKIQLLTFSTLTVHVFQRCASPQVGRLRPFRQEAVPRQVALVESRLESDRFQTLDEEVDVVDGTVVHECHRQTLERGARKYGFV